MVFSRKEKQTNHQPRNETKKNLKETEQQKKIHNKNPRTKNCRSVTRNYKKECQISIDVKP